MLSLSKSKCQLKKNRAVDWPLTGKSEIAKHTEKHYFQVIPTCAKGNLINVQAIALNLHGLTGAI
jgi:hypothetical protein